MEQERHINPPGSNAYQQHLAALTWVLITAAVSAAAAAASAVALPAD